MEDRYHRPKEPVITEESKAWVLSLACTKPKEHGLAAELWSLSALARFTREHAAAQGHPSLVRAGKATIWRILHAGEIKPHKVRYYLERRDAQFEEKMREVLMVYQEVALQNAASASNEGASSVITVSLDEKPGVQAIENTAADLPPVPGQHSTWSRDHEYKRHGTLSILAAVDLHNGEIFAQVHPRHRSREYILLLKELERYRSESEERPREKLLQEEGEGEELAEQQPLKRSPGQTGRDPEATDAAKQKAEELGVDLSGVEGTGTYGRIIITDVLSAASRGMTKHRR